jgi:rSAM/selenodomain-associated transferase 1
MASSAPPPEVRVAVFAKAPRPGEVKTRLIPVLGEALATSLHAALVERTLATAAAANVGPVELWCAPDAADPFFRAQAGRIGARLAVQPAGDLGARMAGAFEAAFGDNCAMLLIGCDCPGFEAAHLREAAAALASNDAVFVPAEDGGYMLVGLSRPVPALFQGIPWGTGEVMARTRGRLRQAGARWVELAPLWDVDRPEDVARLRASGFAGWP